ncbi:putative DnaJ domain, Chaperone J-domain superfamily [Helianthus annuus]|nr:putative DnaJ domain, Chaperone J-domain superfamily [Helianthus annuus]KAJ0458743.1 putative DnaJ domain, Chaperone J-domain superfamily [Helianthus annuus]KAJ0639292.1 putative DnaJ domain, Chaperone J-domain superfamily [Helianthus annuus]KAJ0643279.1 putative DnaJ domain, Chaperone J-domain superfamily [Helianthus annuus]KAJ0680107.1 putative DnaJ domain, Chaperone J-domain superfamily [Helianthus annuus]
MACVAGMMNGYMSSSTASSSSFGKLKNSHKKKTNRNDRRFRIGVTCVSSSPVALDPYKTLSIRPDASESEVKKAFRQLALKYHPDVCRGSNCGVQFHQINEAYDTVMSNLRDETSVSEMDMYGPPDAGIDEPMRGMDDPDWDMWEEWMGWEGAGIRDYTSHINPYI